MSDNAMILHDGSAMSAYQDRDDVRELGDRLMAMHPAASEVGPAAMRAAAQLSLMLGANPLPGPNEVHIWKDNKGRPCMSLGIGYWRRKGWEWGGYLYQVQPRPMKPAEITEYGIPNGTQAAICKGVRAADMIQYRQMGFTTNEIWDMCGRTGVGTQGPNEYAKTGRPNIWTALKRAEADMLRQLFPAEFARIDRQTMTEAAPLLTIAAVEPLTIEDGGDVDGDHEAEEGRYTLDDANADFGLGQQPPAAPAAPPPVDPVAAFVAQAERRESVQNVSFANGRLTAWANYVTGNNYDPARADLLNQVLDRYCSAVADNGNTHTTAAAKKAKTDYEAGLAALAEATEPPVAHDEPLFELPVVDPA